jgi:hypothetical protein
MLIWRPSQYIHLYSRQDSRKKDTVSSTSFDEVRNLRVNSNSSAESSSNSRLDLSSFTDEVGLLEEKKSEISHRVSYAWLKVRTARKDTHGSIGNQSTKELCGGAGIEVLQILKNESRDITNGQGCECMVLGSDAVESVEDGGFNSFNSREDRLAI